MTKSKKNKAGSNKAREDGFTSSTMLEKSTLSMLRANSQLWYNICVLVYDLQNISKYHNSEKRTLSTTDELYISTPYFTPAEAIQIKATMIDTTSNNEDSQIDDITFPDNQKLEEVIGKSDGSAVMAAPESQTIEEAIKSSLANFFEKRRASGDSRPCGPHDIIPICLRVFGIEPKEIQDERFLGRLRRSGLAT